MIRDLIQGISGYPGLLLFCASSGLAFPLPEDFSLVYAGVQLNLGEWAWFPTILVALVGVGIRDVVAFGIGRSVGGWLLSKDWVNRLMGPGKIERAKELVTSHGASAVLAGRFFIGFRAPLFMVAGAMGVRTREFLFWDGIGLLVAVPVTIGLGFVFGDPIADGMFWLMQRTRVALAVGVVLCGVVVLWRMYRPSPPVTDP